ncbi:MAG: hypothetical protein FWE44_07550 [Defluviitaleaceae bacterium]|nr:hypothetical protein [Defluviitaleaceae bacterium]
MYCLDCNANSRPGASFCETCGKKFAISETDVSPPQQENTPQVVPPIVQESVDESTVQETVTQVHPAQPNQVPNANPAPNPYIPPPQPPTKNKTGLIVGLITVGLVIAAAILLILIDPFDWNIFNRNNSDSNISANNQGQEQDDAEYSTYAEQLLLYRPWQNFGYTNTYQQILVRYIVNIEWSEQIAGGVVNGIILNGNVRGTNENIEIRWSIDRHHHDHLHFTPDRIMLDWALYTSHWDIEDFMWFMLDAFIDGYQLLPMYDWWAWYDWDGGDGDWWDDDWNDDWDWWDDGYAYMVDPALVGSWQIIDNTARGWFVGGETLHFFADGFGEEHLFNTWGFEWFADGWGLEIYFFDHHIGDLFYYYEVIEGQLHLFAEDGSYSIIFNRQ